MARSQAAVDVFAAATEGATDGASSSASHLQAPCKGSRGLLATDWPLTGHWLPLPVAALRGQTRPVWTDAP